jgi:hypothetical protein
MRFRNPIFGILSVVFAGLFLQVFKETSWAIFVESFLEEIARSFGIQRAAMIAVMSQVLLGGGLLWALLYFAFRVGKLERPMPPDPALEVARAHTEAIRAQTEALRFSSQPTDAALDAVVFDPNWTRDIFLGEALWYAYSRNWSGWLRLGERDAELFHYVTVELRQYAFEGLLPIWGTRPKSNLYELVPREFWRNHDIASGYSVSCAIPEVFVYVTRQLNLGEVQNARTNAWTSFMTSRDAMEKLWPPRP